MKYILTKSRISLFLFICILAVLWIFAGWNTSNFDLDNYEFRYNQVARDGFVPFSLDYGYSLIQIFFISFGFSFEDYHIWIYFIIFIVLGFFILKWSHLPLLVIFIYAVSHYVKDVVELRNGLAMVFLLYAFPFFTPRKKSKLLLAALFLYFAFSIHASFILLFVLLFANSNKWNYWYCFIIGIFLSIIAKEIMMVVGNNIPIEGIDSKVDRYADQSPIWATIVMSTLAFVNGICISFFRKTISNDTVILNQRINNLIFSEYVDIVYALNCLLNFLLIFTAISASFYARLFTNFQLINFIFMTNIIYLSKRKRMANIMILLLYISVYLYFVQIVPFWEHLAFILNNNSLLSLKLVSI